MNTEDAKQIAEALAAAIKPTPTPKTELEQIAADLAAIAPLSPNATAEQKSQQAVARERLLKRRLEIQGHRVRDIGIGDRGVELLAKYGAV